MAKEYARKLWSDGINWNTFNYHVKALHLVFRILLGSRDNVWSCDNIKRKEKIRMNVRQALTEEEVVKLLNSFDTPELSVPFKEEMKTLFNIGMWTGLRLADAILLKWGSVRFKQNIIKLIPVKTRKIQRQIEIPIHPLLSTELKKAEKGDCEMNDYVVPNLARFYLKQPFYLNKELMKVFTHNGFETTVEVTGKGQRLRKANQYGFHVLRHTFSTFAASRGVPVMILSQVLGDDVKTLQDYYTHLTHEVKGKIFAALPMISLAEGGIAVNKEQPSENKEIILEKRISRAIELIKSSGNMTEKDHELMKILAG
jgi:integrase